MKIVVKTLTNKNLECDINLSCTILDLKNIIEKRYDIPVDSQRLCYNSRQLDDKYTLEYYDITSESKLMLVMKLCGGGLSFSNLDYIKKYTICTDGPSYHTLCKGLNIRIRCKNVFCDTKEYDGYAIIPKGYGSRER
jgi:hypothetical protein